MSYISEVIEQTELKNPNQPQFMQTVKEVLTSLAPAVEQNESVLRKNVILERMVEPDRQIVFRVPWMDDNGVYHVNRGFRVQFNNAIGPYKGGLRFQKDVNLDAMKFLGFEQTFKNSLTSLPMGGAKGGADFDPTGKSDAEVMRFCQSFMNELYRHIGPDMDVPAGDMGVGGREIGYLFGQYKKIVGAYKNGVLTGKGLSYGGSLIRPEATGFGATYFLDEVLKHEGEQLKGKTFCLSGFGNVAWGAAKKISELGGKVVTLSGPDGYIYDEDGVSGEKIDFMLEMRASNRNKVKDYADKYEVREDGVIEIDADVIVEKQNHKAIVLGKGGSMIKKIATYARQDLENITGAKIFITLWVRVRDAWRDSDAILGELGYTKKNDEL